MTTYENHDDAIRDQFTQQAVPFSQLNGHFDALALLFEMTQLTAMDTVLDVACGPGLVACAFARVAAHVTGVDLTEAMLGEAVKRQQAEGLQNIEWQAAAAQHLPYPDATFSVVISRYAFHHFIDPAAVLAEMVRVCKPGGRILVADPALPEECVDAFNAMERLRDPSHAQAFSAAGFADLFNNSAVRQLQRATYEVTLELEQQLAVSFPAAGGKDALRALFRQDLSEQKLGTQTRLVDGAVYYTYPIVAYCGKK